MTKKIKFQFVLKSVLLTLIFSRYVTMCSNAAIGFLTYCLPEFPVANFRESVHPTGAVPAWYGPCGTGNEK